MDHRSGGWQQLWEAMEACRSGSDDLSDPRFSGLADRLAVDEELLGQFQRLQEADEAIKIAFARVSVPPDLAVRIAQRLTEQMGLAEEQHLAEEQRLAELTDAATSGSQDAASDSLATGPVTMLPVTVLAATMPDSPAPRWESTEWFSRRRLLVGFAALSAAATLLAAVWIETHLPRNVTSTSVIEEAMDFFDKDNQPAGELGSQVPPPAGYPISPDIIRLQGIRWRNVATFLGGSAVAYDLPTVGGRATLYVVQRTVSGLPSIPPAVPLSTGGKSAAAWQSGGALYVLVVAGDAGMYSSYLDQSHGPLT